MRIAEFRESSDSWILIAILATHSSSSSAPALEHTYLMMAQVQRSSWKFYGLQAQHNSISYILCLSFSSFSEELLVLSCS